MNVNFELYKVFYHVADTLSFSAASEQLYISQSAVSQSIKLLEEKMSCSLFIRSTKQVRLTREGEMLFRHVEQAFHTLKAGERNIEEIHSLQQGQVKIGASDTICIYHLIPYLQKFSALYPQIKIQITNRTSPECIELLKKGTIDFCVINLPRKKPSPDMDLYPIQRIKDVFVAGKPYHDLQGKELSLKELESYPFLMLEQNTTTRTYFDELIRHVGVDIKPEIELGSIDLLIDLVKIGLGLSFVPWDYVEKDVKESRLFPLKIIEKIQERDLGIVTSQRIPLPLAASKFIDLLLKRQEC